MPLLITGLISVYGGGMGIKSDIEEAIYSHGAWKTHFRNFLCGKAGMDMSAVGHTDACKLGHWLEDGARRMMSPEDHAKACELHAQFHRVAGDIVRNITQKNFSAARQALASAGAFDQASHEMGAFLRKVALHGRPKTASQPEEAKPAVELTNLP
jgi:hypothetical protein